MSVWQGCIGCCPFQLICNVIVVIAGMEGALASVVGGLTNAPVIAVPTSVGYGASFGGLAALLAMLNSCATGVAVVNIDNGFGAGFMAAMINQKIVGGGEVGEKGRWGERGIGEGGWGRCPSRVYLFTCLLFTYLPALPIYLFLSTHFLLQEKRWNLQKNYPR